jgi:hypothetical protein
MADHVGLLEQPAPPACDHPQMAQVTKPIAIRLR